MVKEPYNNLRNILEFKILGKREHYPPEFLKDDAEKVGFAFSLLCMQAPIEEIRGYIDRYTQNGNKISSKLFEDIFSRACEIYRESTTIM